jgi:uncharacterized membrane protein
MTDSAKPCRAPWLLLPIILVAAFLRFYDLTKTSLWMDELWSIEMSVGRGSPHDHLPTGQIQTTQINLTSLQNAPPWWQIWTHLTGLTTPPLYVICLRWWIDLLGNSPAATRSLSAIFSLASILLFYDVCRLLHGQRIALLASAIMAVAPAQIDFAQETRNYSPLIFFALCCADALVRLERLGPSRKRSWSLGLSLLAAGLTHYFAIGAIVALAVYAAIKRVRSALAPFIIAIAAGGVLWGWEFYRQIATLPSDHPAFIYSDDPNHAAAAALQLIGQCAQWIVGQTYAGALPATVMILLTAAVILLPLARLHWRKDTALWLIWIAATALPLAASDMFRHTTFLDYLRYTILASPAAYALLASIDYPPRPVIRDTIGFCALALAAFFALERLHQGPTTHEDWRELTTKLDQQAGQNELLVFIGNDPWITPGTWYMGLKYYAPQSTRPWLILREPADANLLAQMSARHTLWVIGKYPTIEGPAYLPGWRPVTGFATTAGAAYRFVHP